MKNGNQLKIGAVLSYVSIFVNMAIQLLYTPVMLRLLGQAEYGVYTLVSSIVSYLSLFSLGFTGAYLRYYSQAASKDDKKEVPRLNGMFLTIFIVMGCVAMICGLILSNYPTQIFGTKLSPNELNKAQFLMRILVVNIALTFPASVYDSIITSQEKFVFQKAIGLLGNIFNPLISLPCLILGYGSTALVIVTTFITVTKLIVSIWFCYYKLGVRFAFDHFEIKKLKSISGFSFFVFINMIIDQLNWSIDNLILGRMVGALEVAIYGVANQLRGVFGMFSSPISSVFAPRINQLVVQNRPNMNEELTDLVVRVGRIQYMILLYLFGGFAFCGKTFVVWWAGEQYVRSYYVTFFLILPLVYILPCNLGVEIRKAKNKHRFPAVIMLVTAVLNLIVSLILVHPYGAVGAAVGTCVGLTVNIIWMSYYYTKKLGIGMIQLFKNMLKITVGAIVPIGFGMIGMIFDRLSICILWAIAYSAVYIVFLYKYVLTVSEKQLVGDMLNKISLRKK